MGANFSYPFKFILIHDIHISQDVRDKAIKRVIIMKAQGPGEQRSMTGKNINITTEATWRAMIGIVGGE